MVKPAPRTQEEMLSDIREQLELLSFRRPSQVGTLPPDVWRHAGTAQVAATLTLGSPDIRPLPGMSVVASLARETRVRMYAQMIVRPESTQLQVTLQVRTGDGAILAETREATAVGQERTVSLIAEAVVPEGVTEFTLWAKVNTGSATTLAGDYRPTILAVDYLTQ